MTKCGWVQVGGVYINVLYSHSVRVQSTDTTDFYKDFDQGSLVKI